MKVKQNSFKKIYIFICLTIIILLGFFQLTKALFINTSSNVITNIRVGDLKYQLSSTSFKPNTSQVDIDPNKERSIFIDVISLNRIETKYELYYDIEGQELPIEGLEVSYSEALDPISDTIGTNESIKTVLLTIKNTTTNNYILEFKINSGYSHNPLALKELIINPKEPIIQVDIVDNMIPIKWDTNKWVKADKNNTHNEWYDYDDLKWANSVLVTNESRESYKSANINTEVLEKDILSYYVYIPRYRYLLWNANYNQNCLNDNCAEQEILVEFERKNDPKSVGNQNGQWLTHPAFTFGDDEINGFWVGKFAASADSGSSCLTTPSIDNCNNKNIKPRTIPNVDMWKYVDVSTVYSVTKKVGSDNIHGLADYNNVDSHLMKNMEWGALAYLYYSKYGKYGNDDYSGENKQLYVNNYQMSAANLYRTLTGCSSGNPDQSVNNDTCAYLYPDQSNEALGTTSTGNIYGVYDMSGGVWEYVMGQTVAEGTPLGTFNANASSGTWDEIPEAKYFDSYAYSDDHLSQERGYLGDATREILLHPGTTQNGGWYGDRSRFPASTTMWFLRGGRAANNTLAGAFAYSQHSGGSNYLYGFRMTLTFIN